MLGARNRARAAFENGPCDLAVGIEDGLVRLAASDEEGSGLEDVYNVGCAWLTDGTREGHGFSSGFAYPPDCVAPAWRERAPIGDLFDARWRAARSPDPPAAGPATDAPSGRGVGNIGMLTGGRLDRSAYGAQAVVCGLVRFLHTDLYD